MKIIILIISVIFFGAIIHAQQLNWGKVLKYNENQGIMMKLSMLQNILNKEDGKNLKFIATKDAINNKDDIFSHGKDVIF